MRIAFDLDDTLVPAADGGVERPPRPHRWRFREKLRPGATDMLRHLVSTGHDVWIYTSSLRSERYVRNWFRCLGIHLGGIVNRQRHESTLAGSDLRSSSKYPPAFGIELLVDDSPGVGEEGRRHGFEVLVIPPEANDWTDRVIDAVAATQRREA